MKPSERVAVIQRALDIWCGAKCTPLTAIMQPKRYLCHAVACAANEHGVSPFEFAQHIKSFLYNELGSLEDSYPSSSRNEFLFYLGQYDEHFPSPEVLRLHILERMLSEARVQLSTT